MDLAVFFAFGLRSIAKVTDRYAALGKDPVFRSHEAVRFPDVPVNFGEIGKSRSMNFGEIGELGG